MAQFNPKRVLRQISNALLKEFFEGHGHALPIPWDEITNTQINEVFRAWQALADTPRRQIEVIFHDLDEMANEDGIRVLVDEGRNRDIDLAVSMESMESSFDKAMWVYLNHNLIWDASVMFARADSLSSARSWTRRVDMPVVAPGTNPDDLKKMQEALSAFYRERQGRGHHCRIEHFKRGSNHDYFFVYLSDYADTYINFDDAGKFQRTPERRAFEIVFAYDHQTGTLDMFAKGGRKIVEPLQKIFSRVILGEDLRAEDVSANPYDLNHLMERNFKFPTEPEDGVVQVSLRRLRLSVVGNQRRRITLEADANGQREDIYDMLERDLNVNKLPRSVLHVTKATFNLQFNGNGHGRSLTFDVTHPNSCNLKSKREDHRIIGEKYLKKWKIDVS